MDMAAAAQLSREDLAHQLAELVAEILAELKLRLNLKEQQGLVELLLNDMSGSGRSSRCSRRDHDRHHGQRRQQVYVERRGKLEL